MEDSFRNRVVNPMRFVRFFTCIALFFHCLGPHVARANEGATAPNMMIIIDNSTSMMNVVPEAPYTGATTYPCSAKETLLPASPGSFVPGEGDIVIPDYPRSASAGIRFWYLKKNYIWGKTACFHPDKVYRAVLAIPDDPIYGPFANDPFRVIEEPGVYSGNYLNWYFADFTPQNITLAKYINKSGHANALPHWLRGDDRYFRYRRRPLAEQMGHLKIRPGARTRLEVAIETALKIVERFPEVRIGFATLTPYGGVINVSADNQRPKKLSWAIRETNFNLYSSYSGGFYPYLWSPAQVDNDFIKTSPIAAALRDVGAYFRGADGPRNPGNSDISSCTVNGQSRPLPPSPGEKRFPSWRDENLFNPRSCPGCSTPVAVQERYNYRNRMPTARKIHPDGQRKGPITVWGESRESPICTWCQKNIAVLISDGLYRGDGYRLPKRLADYDGDGDGTDRFPDGLIGDKNDYLDDVAAALFDIDLRSDINDPQGNPIKNNVRTFTLGFPRDDRLSAVSRSESSVSVAYRYGGTATTVLHKDASHSPYENAYRERLGEDLLKDTAARGGGEFTYATRLEDSVKALERGLAGGCRAKATTPKCGDGSGSGSYVVYAAGTQQINKYSPSGEFLFSWKIFNSKRFAIDNRYRICDIDTDSKGNVFAVYGTPNRINSVERWKRPKSVLAKYSSDGELLAEYPLNLWEPMPDPPLRDCPLGIATDYEDNVWVASPARGFLGFSNDLGPFARMGNWGSYCILGCGATDLAFDRWNHMLSVQNRSGQLHLKELDRSGNQQSGGFAGYRISPRRIAYDGKGSAVITRSGWSGSSPIFLGEAWNERYYESKGGGRGQGLSRASRELYNRKIYSLIGVAVAPDQKTFLGSRTGQIVVLKPTGDLDEIWDIRKPGESLGTVWGVAIGRGGSGVAKSPPFISPACDTDVIGSAAPVSSDARGRGAARGLFLTQYSPRHWTGDLKSFLIKSDGQPGAQRWSAAQELDSGRGSASNRVLLTWGRPINGKASKTDSRGVAFRWDNLWESQQQALAATTPSADGICGSAEAGKKVLDYIRGDMGEASFRKRDSLLGAIVHSRAIYVADPKLNWPGAKYARFKAAHHDRKPIIYVGANDGALHGFDAETGKEVIGYFPATLLDMGSISGLSYFANPNYQFQYLVDGTPAVSDAFISTPLSTSKQWRTVLISTLRGGGRGLFAIDVTDPKLFKEQYARSLVLWEFNNTHDAHLGYTFSEPTITLMNDGRWAAIIGNGYDDTASDATGGHAQLFIIYVDGGIDGEWTEGRDYLRISTGVGSTANRNGLATPAVVDLNGDGTADRAYAGDLEGNLWAFDLSARAASNWKVAYGTKAEPKPVFIARSQDGTPQPITVEPVVTRQSLAPGQPPPNLMVYFGTGRHILESDKTDTATQSFYAVWDRRQGNLARNALARQRILFESMRAGGKGRVTDPELMVDYQWKDDTHYGWYLDLPEKGERVVNNPKVRGKTVFFNTTIPDPAGCGFGGNGWMMSVATSNGGSPQKRDPVFDFDGDGAVNLINDTVVFRDRRYAYAGKMFETGGAPAGPALVPARDRHMRYTAGDETTDIDAALLNEEDRLEGRIAWQQAYPEVAQTKRNASDNQEDREDNRNK